MSADDYAFAQMMKRGIDPINFATIMEKLEQTVATDGEHGEGDEEVAVDREASSKTSFLSTHPATRERVEKAREMSERFNEG